MGSHQGFIYMLLTFRLLKLFRKPVALLCDILMLYLFTQEYYIYRGQRPELINLGIHRIENYYIVLLYDTVYMLLHP
jgi:hypothetical protein